MRQSDFFAANGRPLGSGGRHPRTSLLADVRHICKGGVFSVAVSLFLNVRVRIASRLGAAAAVCRSGLRFGIAPMSKRKAATPVAEVWGVMRFC